MRERVGAHEEVGRFDVPVHEVARVNEFDEGELLGLKGQNVSAECRTEDYEPANEKKWHGRHLTPAALSITG